MKARFLALVAFAVLLAVSAAQGQVTPITLHPAADTEPAVSPDGRWLVYVSARAGAPSMYRRDLNAKRVAADEPLYPHTAGSTNPVFSPTGKKIAFVSARNDAFGDVFLADFPSGKPRAVTMRGRIDRTPVFSADGTRLWFQSNVPDELPEWFYFEIRTGEIERGNGDEPARAFAVEPPYSVESADYGGGAALLFADDTNADGILGEGDQASAWELDKGVWRQATPPLKRTAGISRNQRTGRLYVSTALGANQDIVAYGKTLLRGDASPEELLDRGRSEGLSPTPDKDLAVSYFRAAYRRTASLSIREEAAISYLKALLQSERWGQAATESRRLAAEFEDEGIENRLSLFRLAATIAQSPPESSGDSDLAAVRELMAAFESAGDSRFAAESRLVLAEALLALSEFSQALAQAQHVSMTDAVEVSGDQKARALLLQSRIYGRMGLSGETEQALFDVFARDPERASILESAADAFLEIQRQEARSQAELVLVLRNAAAQAADYPYLQARVYTESARILVELNDYAAADAAFVQAEELMEWAPVPAVEAAIRHARVLAEQENYTGSVAILKRAEEQLSAGLRLDELDPRIQETYDRVRRALIRYFLAKGRREMALGDPMLAQATYGDLLDFDPGLAAAWRGRISAIAARPDALKRMMKKWEKEEARGPRGEALLLYRQALARSYFDPSSRRVQRMLSDAIAIDPSVPQYYLTNGYVLEQLYRDKSARGHKAVDLLEQALANYEQAMGLADRELDPPFYADVLLNLGNASSELGQYARAAGYYQQRSREEIGFDDRRTEFLFHWNYGLASFRAANPQRAVGEFEAAANMLDALHERELISERERDGLGLELAGRRALALLDAGRLDEADAMFERLYKLSKDRSLAGVRAVRNRAYIALLQALDAEGADRVDALRRARSHAGKALALLADAKKETSRPIAGGGVFNLTFEFAADPSTGGSQLDFNKAGEERLLRSLLARVASLLGDPTEASEQLRQQISLSPKLTSANRAYLTSIRSVSLNRLASATNELGNTDAALSYVLEGLALSRFTIEGEVIINSSAATRMVLQAAELLLAGANPMLVEDSEAFWMLDEKPLPAWAIVERAAEALLRMPDPLYNDPAVLLASLPEERARLLAARSLAAEMQFRELLRASGELEGIASIQSAVAGVAAGYRVIESADELLKIAREEARGGEAYRLAVLAQGAAIRVESRFDGDSPRLEESAAFAREAGYGHLAWWLLGQRAIGAGDSLARADAAGRAADELLNQFVYTTGDTESPWGLFDQLEVFQLRAARDARDAEACWEAAERWRTIRLRWLASMSAPTPESAAERQWVERFEDARRELVSIQKDLQALPFSATSARRRLLERDQAARPRLAALMEEGAAYPSRRYVRPEPASFATLDALLESAESLYGPTVIVLNRKIQGFELACVYTNGESRIASGVEEIPDADTIFVLGGEIDLDNAVSLVSTEALYRRASEPSFRAGAEPLVIPSPEGDWRRLLPGSYAVELESPVAAVGLDPRVWMLEGEEISLDQIFAAGSPLAEAAVVLDQSAAAGERPRELALAAWLAQAGLVQARIDNRPWIAKPLDPRKNRGAARTRLEELYGRYRTAMDEEDWPRAIALLEEVLHLNLALDEEEELGTVYQQLAELYAEEDQAGKASNAASRWIDVLTGEEVPAEKLAAAWEKAAGFAEFARDWDAMDAAFAKAIDLYKQAGSVEKQYAVMLDFGFALENSGRYAEALEHFQSMQSMAALLGAKAEAEMYIRLARLERLYFSRYIDAEEALRSALALAEVNGLAEVRLETLLNLARVLQNLARFGEAMEVLDKSESLAEDIDAREYLAEVALERANIHWYRSEYFDAYREQEKAVRLATELDDPATLLSAYNVSGLIAWSLNDYDRAYADLERARAIGDVLVEKFGMTNESATTWNNLGLVYRSEEKFAEALGHFQHALEMDQRAGNRWGEAYALRNKAITLTRMDNAAEAIPLLRDALSITRDIGDKVNEAKARFALAEALAQTGSGDEAARLYNNALVMARTIPIRELEWRSLYGLGQVAQATGGETEAIRLYSEAIDVVDTMRASIRVEELQDGFLRDKQDLYDTMIDLQLRRGETREALETSEKSRGRNFIDLLGNKRLTVRDEVDQELLDREGKLRERVETLEKKVSSAPAGNVEQLREELARARQEYSDFLVLLRAESPQLSNFVSVPAVDIEELQSLLDSDVRLLVYHVLPNRLVAWVLGPDTLNVRWTYIQAGELSRLVGETRAGLQSFDDVNEELSELALALVTPVLGDIAGIDRLGIVPHRALHTLPFAALRFGPGEHLIDRAAIFYTPSASVLRYTIGRRDEPKSNAVLSIGNPDRQSARYDLPFAEKEAKRLRFDFEDVTVRVGEEATESWVTEHLQDFGIIHIASHGEYDPDAPLFSAVLLAPDEEADGTLTAEEVFGLRVRADLVALSACQTGLGRVSSGDDIVGLNRAFVYAGTHQLLTTLWRVDDISTAILFKYFYRNLDGIDRAEALRRAQIRLKNRPEYIHPAHWAGLVLSGDWE